MGSPRALVCSIAFALVVLSSASQEMQQPDSVMMQEEFDLSDVFDAGEFPIEQMMIPSSEQHDTLSEGNRGVRPRSFGGPPMLNYRVQFPLAQPSSDNLQAICLHAARRPHYPDSYFPDSGFGQLKRRASAINKAESWFNTCCQGNDTWGREATRCCAIQAWELSVKSFCEDDTSVKDRIYECCKKTGNARLNCFHNDAPNPSYMPTEELPIPERPVSDGFSFDPSTCQRTSTVQQSGRGGKKVKKLSGSETISIRFPPGQPTADVIKSLCHNQKQRPLYTVKCLPGSGYELLARQAKTINRMEKKFKLCCKKKNRLTCADRKWREELNKFCVPEKGQQVDFQCCSENDRFNCFQNISPDPHYNMTSAPEELSLSKICDTHKIIKQKFPVGMPVKKLVSECCPLSEEDKTSCFQQRIKIMSTSMCSSRKASPTIRRCCRSSSMDFQQCMSKTLIDAVTKATKFLHQKKKKICPLT
ncbi:extracellular matrix protein 1-like isoform X2 [Brachionichthys hirsutus]|uniref:extracellular matrix protein 1-like isoform X2 n=1 Tax=Brachionichthys hirsutus TaxID=412623 RepID=UPI0036047B55